MIGRKYKPDFVYVMNEYSCLKLLYVNTNKGKQGKRELSGEPHPKPSPNTTEKFCMRIQDLNIVFGGGPAGGRDGLRKSRRKIVRGGVKENCTVCEVTVTFAKARC